MAPPPARGSGDFLPSFTVAACGLIWGLYWIPLRYLQGLGFDGNWVTTGLFLLGLPPILVLGWSTIGELRAGGMRLIFVAVANGAVFGLYANAYAYTTIFNVLFLFYLSPVWAVLIARFWTGERVGIARLGCIVAGLGGLVLMMGADGGWPIPRNLGDWMALGSGLLWAVVAVEIRGNYKISARANALAFFIGGGLVALLFAIGMGAPIPTWEAIAVAAPVLLGVSWLGWAPTQVLMFWGIKRISPVRSGMLMMTEVLSGVVTAALFSHEPFGPRQMAGGALILLAGFLDLLAPSSTAPARPSRSPAE